MDACPYEATAARAILWVSLGENHTVAGNPIRFRNGELTIRPDEEWRLRMSPASRTLVTALTLPALGRYARD